MRDRDWLDRRSELKESLGMAKNSLRPLNDKIVVRRLEAEETTKGGIVLPDAAQEKPKEGVVVAVGTGRLLVNGERADLQLQTEDRVLFTSYAGTEVKVDGEDFLIMNEDDVLAVVD